MDFKYYIDQKKYRIKPNERYIRINGWCFEEQGKGFTYKAEINGKTAECSVKKIEHKDVQEKYKRKLNVPLDCGMHIKAYFADNAEPKSFKLYLVGESEQKCIVSLGRKDIQKIIDESTISYNLDYVHLEQLKIKGAGWVTSVTGADHVRIRVTDSKDENVEMKLQRQRRPDILDAGFIKKEDINCGFMFDFVCEPEESYILVIEDGVKRKKITLNAKEIRKHDNIQKVKGYTKKFITSVNKKNVKKGLRFI